MGMKAHDWPSAAARADAAVWVARLHGPNRTKEVEAGLRRWLADDPQHPAAFDMMTETWEKSARLRRRPIEKVASWEAVGFRLRFSYAASAIISTAVVAVIGTLFYLHTDVIATGVGEFRTLTLQDGTRVFMDSSTRLSVHYEKAQRQVRLESGEAFFEVTKNPRRPFIVRASGHLIRDLGTEFDVRSDAQGLSVTLVEGKVTVSPISAGPNGGALRDTPGSPSVPAPLPPEQPRAFALSAGERLTFTPTGVSRIDHPALAIVTAWQRGQVVLDNTSLADAVSEMNRYSHQKIVIQGAAASAIRVSGVFQAGDSQNFAAAVARTYHMKANQHGEAIILAPSD
jgi:transmembrane sensor